MVRDLRMIMRVLSPTLLLALIAIATPGAGQVVGQPVVVQSRTPPPDPKMVEAREKQLRAALAEPGFHLEERLEQTRELSQLLVATDRAREALALWAPIVELSRSLRQYEGDTLHTWDLEHLIELYHLTGEHGKAAAMHAERVAELSDFFGPRSLLAGVARDRLIGAYLRGEDYDRAFEEWEKSQANLAPTDPRRNVLNFQLLAGLIAKKKLPQLDRVIELTLARASGAPVSDSTSRVTVAKLLIDGGLVERGRELLDRELVELRRSKGADADEVIEITEQLGRTCLAYGLTDLGNERIRDARALLEKRFGAHHEKTLRHRVNLASLLYFLKGTDESLKGYAEVTPLLKEHLGYDHPLTQEAVKSWLYVLESTGKDAEAEPLRRQAVKELSEARKDPADPKLVEARAFLARNLLRQAKGVEAEAILRDVLTIRRKQEPEGWATFSAASMLGESLLIQKKTSEAEPLLVEGFQGLRKALYRSAAAGAAQQLLPDAARRLVTLYDQTDRRPEGDKYRRYVPQAAGRKN